MEVKRYGKDLYQDETCNRCNSVLTVCPADVHASDVSADYVTCPVCGNKVFLVAKTTAFRLEVARINGIQ